MKAATTTAQQRRNRRRKSAPEEAALPGKYARKCKRCKLGYDPRRSVVHGQVFWLHDYVIPCGAGELREQHYQEAHKPAAAG